VRCVGGLLQHVPADVWVVKERELGSADCQQVHCRTHLGHLLTAGDIVLGSVLPLISVLSSFDILPVYKQARSLLGRIAFCSTRDSAFSYKFPRLSITFVHPA